MRTYLVLNGAREVTMQLIEGVHDIPEGAVLVDYERWHEVTQDIGSTWQMSEDGKLSKTPKLEIAEDSLKIEREYRDQLLSATEWLVNRHRDELDLGCETSLTGVQYQEVLLYRQNLRDWPLALAFPDATARPKAPQWLPQGHGVAQ